MPAEPTTEESFDWHFDLAPRCALRALTDVHRALPALEVRLVDQARALGVPWRSIASDLGISTTAAYRRHAAHDERTARRRRERELWRAAGRPF